MIIGKIWDYEYPWDVRVEKVTEALLDAGHEVHLFCRNRKGQPQHERIGRLEVHRMPSWRRYGAWLDNVSSFPAFMNPRWVGHVLRSARAARVEALLCRDLPLAPLTLYAGRRLGVPVVVDIAENYPAMLKHVFHWRGFRPYNLLVRNPALARMVERSVVQRADRLLAVVEESRARLVRMGAQPDRVEVVCNTPTDSRIEEMGRIAEARRNDAGAGPLRLVYLGLLGRSRGIEVVLEAVRLLKDEGVAVHFDVIGGDESGVHRRNVRRLKLEDRVTLHGHRPYDEALRVVAAADVGLVPHHATEHWCTTIPNKLFDYMAAALPVIVSDAPPTRRVVEEEECGLVFRDRDPRHLAAQIRRLQDPVLRARMGEGGRLAVLRHYNWTRDARRLTELVEKLAGESSSRSGEPPQLLRLTAAR